MCTLVLQATFREASSRKGQESQLSKENSGQPQGEVSSHESFRIVKFQVHVKVFLAVEICPKKRPSQHFIH